MRTQRKNVLALLGALFLLNNTVTAAELNRARADFKNTQGESVATASFRETQDGVLIIINAKGLPEGLHAVHIHSVGKCEAPAFASAGGHFNPLAKKHGLLSPEGPHAGDLPDMYVNKDGTGRYEALMESVTLGSGDTSIFDSDGSSIVIHATADDNMSDPAGNSGDRIGCGVIAKAAVEKK